MKENDLRALIDDVRTGNVSRRQFVQMMVGLGLSAPLATQMLLHSGVANAQTPAFKYAPTKRGGGGTLKLLWWQGPTLLNPHFATGTKDQDGSRLFHEPLAAWDNDGNLIPILADGIPSLENGAVSKDGKSVVWKIKKGVQWHDGAPLTADDLIFNAEYAADPATAAISIATYRDVKVDKIDTHTVKVTFAKPTPFWADPFVGRRGCLIPKHLYNDYRGAKSRDAPSNLKPVGTGPYKFVDFKPGDSVRGVLNPNYHENNRPFFDAFELKGGGDAVSAARAVLQTGEYDYAWNTQVEDEILRKLEQGGKGKVAMELTSGIEMLQMQCADPWNEVDGERASVKSKHPILTEPAVRSAMNLLVDRGSIQEHIYGRAGIATRNFINNPPRYRSPNTTWEFNVDKANALLDGAGWKKGADGIRAKDGKKMKFVFTTSINSPRQKCQQIIKQACGKAGIDLELKAVVASVYFSSDVANPDTYTKFYADLQMYNTNMAEPDPELFMTQWVSWDVAQKANKWLGRNQSRWVNADFDKLYRTAETELDPVKRAAMFIRMNDMLIENCAVIPIVNRPQVSAQANKLRPHISGWDNQTALLKDWYREA